LKTTFKNNKTGPVSNIGKPFNTRKNDMGFVISGKGESAFFIRDLDIYFADLEHVNDEVKPSSSSLIYGKVMFNRKPVQAELIVQSNGETLGETETDENGKYSISISNSFLNATVFVKENIDSVFTSKEIISKGQRYEEFEVDFRAQKMEVEPQLKQVNMDEDRTEKEVAHEIIVYFDFDQARIENTEIIKLKSLLNIVHPGSIVFIVGHTDHIGTEDYNTNLSTKRAEAVKDWFDQNARLKTTQIELKFKGEAETLNDGITHKERAKNRRVTVKVISN
jgi:outer membrane protein OmpA-like peptidoglycan-associated protein